MWNFLADVISSGADWCFQICKTISAGTLHELRRLPMFN